MAGILKLIYTQEFVNTDTIEIIHNSGYEYLKVKVIIGALYSSNIVKNIITNKSDPTNILTVTLESPQTGSIQLFGIDTIDIGASSSTELHIVPDIVQEAIEEEVVTLSGSVAYFSKVSEDDILPGYLEDKIKGIKNITVINPKPLDERLLIVQYLINEAESGTEPPKLIDNADNPLNLPIDYAGNVEYYMINSCIGLRWFENEGFGGAYHYIEHTKIHDCLNRSRKAVWEVMCHIYKAGRDNIVVFLGNKSSEDIFSIRCNSKGRLLFYLNNELYGEIGINHKWKGRFVVHSVFDSEQENVKNRFKVYINGVRVFFHRSEEIPINTDIRFENDDYIGIGNNAEGNRFSFDGEIYYVALYTELTEDQIQVQANRLLYNDNISPTISALHVGNELIVSSRDYHYIDDDELQSTTSTSFMERLILPIVVPIGRLYRISWNFIWSFSSTSYDARFDIRLNEGEVIQSYRIEPKDKGNDQRFPLCGFKTVFLEQGEHRLYLMMCSSRNGYSVNIYSAALEAYVT